MAIDLKENLRNYFSALSGQSSGRALATLRFAFGIMMFVGMARFFIYDWIDLLYIQPKFHFSYYGFSWVKPPEQAWMVYAWFALTGLAALGIAFGYFYRLSTLIFWVGFTAIELWDKSNFLNHYYLVSLLGFLLCVVPAHAEFSLDRYLRKLAIKAPQNWHTEVFKWMFVLVYFYAGVAKIHPDWLFNAQPLKIWLPARAHLPIIGPMMNWDLTPYAFSWFGCLYDLNIGFLLWAPRTRSIAYFLVISFHFLTWVLFPIGIFPWVMMLSTTVFFSEKFHLKIQEWVLNFLNFKGFYNLPQLINTQVNKAVPLWVWALMIFQIAFPFRYVFYNGPLFWTEEGYRFGWRVMLAEKMGYIEFDIKDSKGNTIAQPKLSEYLTPQQEKMMAYQPDMILEFAHFLSREFQQTQSVYPQVFARSWVTLNGRGSQAFTRPEVNLNEIQPLSSTRHWIYPYPYKD